MTELILRSISIFQKWFCLALSLWLMTLSGIATAGKPSGISESEMKLIPPYCPDTMGFKYGDAHSNTSPRAGYWVGLMGGDFWHIHHYCWARINMNRAQKAGVPAQTRKALWEGARGDYLYVIENAQSNFIMLPEVYTRLGEVQLLLGEPSKANEAFSRARAQKPDYWPAYSYWAEFLIKTGHRSEALKIVSSGLAHSPNAGVLLELFKVLGGKPSDIPSPADKRGQSSGPEKATEADAPKNPTSDQDAEEKKAMSD